MKKFNKNLEEVTAYLIGTKDKGTVNGYKETVLELCKQYHKQQLILNGVVASLPSKDAVICEGYNKAKNEDYKNRNSLRHKSQDDYYSGWMDSYDFISKSKG
jgi:hypothetical protein